VGADTPLALRLLLDVDKGTSRLWFDLDEDESYKDPGDPVFRPLPNGRWVLHQHGDGVYSAGAAPRTRVTGPSWTCDTWTPVRPSVWFRCDPNRYEHFVAFTGGEDHFVLSSESAVRCAQLLFGHVWKGDRGGRGRAARVLTRVPITRFEDPTPPSCAGSRSASCTTSARTAWPSASNCTCPRLQGGTPLPTVLYAYPLEYSGATTAGQVRGSAQRFMRLYGASHLYFLLRGYAVLDQTTMPMLGDPETTYDTLCPNW